MQIMKGEEEDLKKKDRKNILKHNGEAMQEGKERDRGALRRRKGNKQEEDEQREEKVKK